MFPDDDKFESVGPDRGWNYEPPCSDVFRDFTSPLYTTDADGWLTYYNEAAADLWGYHPELGKTRWCGCWRIFTTDGEVLPLDQCAMAVAIKEGRPVRGAQAVLERPDGTRIPFMPFPTPLRDASGALVAASNVLLRITRINWAEPADFPAGPWAETMPTTLRAGLELDDLTGSLQTTLATLADVECDYESDCERLEEWSGSTEEKDQILRQLEQKRQRLRAALSKRAEHLKRQARRFIGRQPAVVTRRPARVSAAHYRFN
ncbi:PAS domain-containing protein [Methylobacterium sp. CM6257]